MPSTLTDALNLEKQATGENENTWGSKLNDVLDQIDRAVAGVLTKSVAGAVDVTLTATESENRLIVFTGVLTANISVIWPADERHTVVFNNTSGSFTLTCKPLAGTGAAVQQGQYAVLYSNASTMTALPLVTLTGTQTLTNKTITIADNALTLQDNSDATKQLQLELSGITTATTRTLTVPDASTTLVGTDTTQTLTNKTISGGTISGITDLTVADGGTGASSLTANAVLLGNGTGPLQPVASLGTAGQILTSTGATAPTFQDPVPGVPTGTVLPFASTTAPTGYLLCSGQTVSRTTYATLFATIGTAFGAGDGSTTFSVPDLRGRVIGGMDDIGGVTANRLASGGLALVRHSMGGTGGEDTHTLITNEIPAHTHTVTGFTSFQASINDTTKASYTAGSGTVATTSSTGDGANHNNVQPTILMYFIIKT